MAGGRAKSSLGVMIETFVLPQRLLAVYLFICFRYLGRDRKKLQSTAQF